MSSIWIILSLLLIGTLSILFMLLYVTEKNDRESFEQLCKSYRELVEKQMNEMEILINLSDSLKNESDSLREVEAELYDTIDSQKEELTEKEKRIEELEQDNDRFCEQMQRLFSETCKEGVA